MSIRVLVVDDSAFARKVMSQVLGADSRIEVVGIARDGLDALEKIAELKPDVITLDLVMPELDGVGVLAALAEQESPPRVVVVTMSDADSVLGVAALEAGAFDVVHKPTALATDRLYELGEELVEKVVLAGENKSPRSFVPSKPIVVPGSARSEILVVGASTGGPRAIALLLRALPATFPVPIAVVVHMPPGYTESFARRLDTESQLTVVEASNQLELLPGHVAIARAGVHLRIARNLGRITAVLDPSPVASLHRPSVDVLLESAATVFGARTFGVVLTGMGDDGLKGARAIRERGGHVLVEHASTCVVHGMPRSIAEANLADAEIPLDDMPREILARI